MVLALATAVAAALGAVPAAAVHAGDSRCTYADGTVRVHLAAEHVVRLLVVDREIRYADLTDYSHRGQCGRARVGNTDRIVVTEGQAGRSRLQFDQQIGHFGPGATTESSGRSEIEVRLGTLTDIWIMGRPVGEHITVGRRGVNLNGDGDVDLIGTELTDVNVFLNEGDDHFSGQGGAGTGEPFRTRRWGLVAYGGEGADVLIGSNRGDILDGDWGRDLIRGGPGGDDIDGGDQDDETIAGPGQDVVTGGNGADRIEAGRADDTIFANDNVADAIDGGAGHDIAFTDTNDPDPQRVEDRRYGNP